MLTILQINALLDLQNETTTCKGIKSIYISNYDTLTIRVDWINAGHTWHRWTDGGWVKGQ